MEVSAGPAHKSAPVCPSLPWLLQGRELKVVLALIWDLSRRQGTLSAGTVQELLDLIGAQPHLQDQGWAGQHGGGAGEGAGEGVVPSSRLSRL